MRSLILAVCAASLVACGSNRPASQQRTDTPAPSGIKTYTLASDQDYDEVLTSLFHMNPEQHLKEGKVIRICRAGSACRYIVPADAAANTVTVYEPGGMSAFRDRGPISRGFMDGILDRGINFQVCDMPIVEHPNQRPPCQTERASPT